MHAFAYSTMDNHLFTINDDDNYEMMMMMIRESGETVRFQNGVQIGPP